MATLMASGNGDNGYRPTPLLFPLFLGLFLFGISFTPKDLKLSACGMPSGNFVNNSDEGYRTLVEKQNHPKPLNLKATQKNGEYGLER